MSNPAPAALLSRAAEQLHALADPRRARLLATVLAADPPGPTVAELARSLGSDLRTTARDLAVLTTAGLVGVRDQRVTGSTRTLDDTADRLTAATPASVLLDDRPGLARWFRFGRLTTMPQEQRAEDRARLADLLVRLLPADRELSEPEVNALLAEVGDDVALLRRFLVDAGRLDRRAGRAYRVR